MQLLLGLEPCRLVFNSKRPAYLPLPPHCRGPHARFLVNDAPLVLQSLLMRTREGSHWPPLPSFTFPLLVPAVPCKLRIQSVVLFTIPITEELLVHQMSNKYSDVQMTDFTANWNISRPQAAVVFPGNRPAGIIHFNHQGRVTLVESSSKSFHGIYKLAICCCHKTLR